MPWEIYCDQMKFWNHNRFETGVIDFVGHGLSATITLFPDTTYWYHGLLWQLNNHLHTTDKSSLMLCQRIDVFFFGSFTLWHWHFLKLERAVIETMGMKRKTSMHTQSVKADWSNSMEMIVQLAKESMIRICHVLKKKGGRQLIARARRKQLRLYQIDYDFETWNSFYDNTFFQDIRVTVRLYNAIKHITLFSSI